MNSRIRNAAFLVFFFSFFHCFTGIAQNKILLINGKEINTTSYAVGESFITYKKQGKNSSKTRSLDKFDVFSIIKADSTEDIIYAPDSIDFSIEEARSYIKGEQAAHLYYNKPAVKIAAAAVGLGSSVLSFYGLPIPMVYSVVIGRFNPQKMQLPENYDATLSSKEPFKLGYQKAARNLKIQQSLKWGYISLGIGLTALVIYSANN